MKKIMFLSFLLFSIWGYGQYCTPVFPSGCIDGDNIDSFQIPSAGFSHDNTGCSAASYGDFTAVGSLNISLQAGVDHNFTATHGYGTQLVRIWIDYDGNNVFDDPGELVASASSVGTGSGATFTNGVISIPLSWAPTTTRMRVATRFSTAPIPCNTDGYGEVHDYTVHILPPPTCPAPSNLSSSNVTATSANLVWTDNSTATQWDIEWGTSGFTPTGTPTITGTTSNPYNLSGLTSNQPYSFYVRANCGGAGLSTWSGPHTFTTQLLVAPPVEIDFTNTTPPAGWNTTGWTIGSTRGVTGNPGNNIYKNLYSTVPTGSFTSFNVGPVTSNMVFTFDYIIAKYSSPYAPPAAGSGNFVLEVSTDFGNTYSTVETVVNNGIAGWQSKSYPLTAYAGQNVKFRITGNWISDDYDLAFDNFVLEVPPVCLVASDVVFSNILHNTANVSWTASPDETNGYNWAVMNQGEVPGTHTPVSSGNTSTGITNTTVTGLTQLTHYDFYVQTNCGATNGLSYWFGPNTFQTKADCSIYSLAITSTTGGGVCEEGSATLSATSSGTGTDIHWYDSQTGGTYLGSGSPFTTPSITQTTSFWAEEVVATGVTLTGQGKPIYTVNTAGYGQTAGIVIQATDTFTIIDVEVFADAAGTIPSIQLQTSTGVMLQEITGITVPAGGTVANPLPLTIPLNFQVPGPGTYWLMLVGTTAPNLKRDSSGNTYPYPIGTVGTVPGGRLGTGASATYYFFYNLTVGTGEVLCQSSRVAAVATVHDIVPVTASATQTSINPGTSTALNAASTNSNYIYTWEPAASIAGSNIGATVTTTNLNNHTTFTVTATDSVTNCQATDEITILVFNTALCNNLTITNVVHGNVCDEGTTTLQATSSGTGSGIYWYDAATGGNLLHIGGSFETPFLTATTSYWATEVLHSGNLTGQGFANPATFVNSTSNAGGLLFTVNGPIIIVDVQVFGTNATGGVVTIELRDVDNGNATIASTTASITGGGTIGAPIPHTIPLAFKVPAAGNYRLVRSGATPTGVGLGNVSAANSSFPYPLGSTGQVTGGTTLTTPSTTHFFFFNWTIVEGPILCESTHVEAIATVHEIIDVTVSSDAVPTNAVSPGGNTNLTAASANTNYTYAWTWPGGSASGATINVSPAATTTYTVTATDTVTGCVNTAEIKINVFDITQCNNLSITSTTGGFICDEGTTILSATAPGNPGDEIYWYDAAVGGNKVGTGTTFETPFLTQTTSYWASEVLEGGQTITGVGVVSPTGTGTNSTVNFGIAFTVTEPTTIVSVDVYSVGAGGSFSIALYDANNLVVGNHIASHTVTLAPGTNTVGGEVLHVIPLNFQVPAAGTYRLVRQAGTMTIRSQNTTGVVPSYPQPIGNIGHLIGGHTSLTGAINAGQYMFYNWTFSTAVSLCESPRVEAIATVVNTIPVEASATQTSINPSSSTTLNATSTNANYTYEWTWPGGTPTTGASIVVSPANHTTYTVTATDSVTGCVATDEITILVFNTALCNTLDIMTTTGDSVCAGDTANVSATTSGTGNEVYWYDAATGGNLLGVGAMFETPAVYGTTSFWAAEALVDGIQINPIETIFTVGSSNSVTSTPAAVTFAIQNTNSSPVLLTEVENYMPANTVREHELWYHPTSITGAPGTIDAANGWIHVGGPQTTTSNATDGISMVLDNLSFSIPANTTYRFALVKTANISGSQTFFYWGSSSVLASPNNFADAGVILHVNDSDAGTGSGVVGYGGPLNPANTPRAFTGKVHFEAGYDLCESAREEAVVTITNPVPGGDAVQYFVTGDALTDLTVTGSGLIWYSDAAGTIVIPDTTLLVDGTTYYVSQTVGGCESEMLAITVVVCNAPTALIAGTITTTTAQISWTASASETGGYSWAVFSTGANPATATPVMSGSVATGITTVMVSGLTVNTAYDFYVSTHCGTTVMSDMAGPLMFTTAPCNAPTALTMGTVTHNSAQISWTASATETGGYAWYIFTAGANPNTATPVNSGNVATGITTVNVSSLSASTAYDFYVATLCTGSVESDKAGPLAFTTAPMPCNAPTALSMGTVTQTTAQFSWSASPNETGGYAWYVFASGANPNTATPVTSGNVGTGITTVNVTSLTASTAYDFYVATLCTGGAESSKAGPVMFTTATLPCNAPTALSMGTVTQTTAQFSWSASANETGGYAWYVYASGANPNTATPVTSGNVGTGITTVNVTSLTASTAYDFYVATLCTGGAESPKAGPVSFTTAAMPCDAPTALAVGNVTQNSAQFTWTASATETGGYAWYKFAAGANPNTATPLANGNVATGVTTVNVSGMSPLTAYDFYVSTMCTGGVESSKAGPLSFTTGALVCDEPTALMAGTITETTAEISWTASPSETNGYDWAVFNAGANPLTDTPVDNGSVATGVTSMSITGLTQNTSYDVYVRTNCGTDGLSDWAGPLNFTTQPLGIRNNIIEGFTFYPNPMVNVINIRAKNTIDEVVIFNLIGQKLIDQKIGATTAQFDVSNFASGPYLMQVTSNGQIGIFRIIKK